MAYVLELTDGSLLIPMSLFDVLDVVEESVGTDVRQYLEEWLETEQFELSEDERFENLKDHYETVLSVIADELNQEDQQEALNRVKTIIRREINEFN